MEVEAADLYEQRGVRSHRERRFFRRRKVEVGPDLLYKDYFWNQSFFECNNYMHHGLPNTELSDPQIPVRDLELDPFSARDFSVMYSLNKKKRWMVDELMAEDPEKFQTETLRVSCFSTAVTALHSRFSEVEHYYDILSTLRTRGYHTVHKGKEIHKSSKRALSGAYMKTENPPKRRRGRRIKNPAKAVVDEDDRTAQRWEEDVKSHERRVHLAYVLLRKENKKSCFNANHDISKAAVREHFFWHWGEKPQKPRKPTMQKDLRAFWRFYNEEVELTNEDVSVEGSAKESVDVPFEVSLNDYIVKKVVRNKKSVKNKKMGEFDEYRTLLSQETEKMTEDKNKENQSMPADHQPLEGEVTVEPLIELDECDASISRSASLPLPTTPQMFSATNADGDLVVFREDGTFLNPVPPGVSERYRTKSVEKETNIFSEMPSIAAAAIGDRLEVLNPCQAEERALQLWLEENSAESSGSSAQNRPEECVICFSEGLFLFALSSCGHFSCVECWTHYAAHAIHDNRVPLRCIGVKCAEVLPLSVLQCFLRQESVRRYEKQLANRRLLQNDFFHCKRCDRFLFTTSTDARVLVCACGGAICRGCREEAHAPLSCGNMEKYEDMLRRNGQSFHDTALAHVAGGVKCPRCAGLVDRTGGCNHMECFCGYEFCYACGRPFTGPHYNCQLEAPRDHALIDGAETIHPTVFQKCAAIRRMKNSSNLLRLTRRLEKSPHAETAKDLINRFRQILDFVERSHIHLFLSYQRVNFKRSHLLAHQFAHLVDQRLSFLIERISIEEDIPKMAAMLNSALAICDQVNAKCSRM